MTQRHADQTPDTVRSQRRPAPATPAGATAGGPAWETLQRSLGNQGTQRAMEREAMRAEQQRAGREGVTSVSGDTQLRIDALAARDPAVELPEAAVHAGPEVDQLAHGLDARAFTQGRNVFVSTRGRDTATLAHELTHVSQGQTGHGTVQRAPDEPEEIEMPEMYVGRDPQVAGAADATTPPPNGATTTTAPTEAPAFSMYQTNPLAPIEAPSMLIVPPPTPDPITGGDASPLVSVNEDTGPLVTQTATPPPTPVSPDTGGATAMTTVEEKKEPETQPPTSDATGNGQADAIDSQLKEADEEESDLQVSMTLPAPGEEPTYVKKQKAGSDLLGGPTHPPLDPKVEAIIEGTYEPTYQEKVEKQFDQKLYDEEQQRKQRAAMVGQVPGPRPVKDSLGFTNEEDPGDLPFADSLVTGDFGRNTDYQSSVISQPSTGGEQPPVQSTFPTLKSEEPKKPEEPKPLDPFVPQKFNISITIDNIKKLYEGLTAEEAITQLKVEWNWCWSLVEIYKKWHAELKENRDDHPIVGFICDRVFGNGDPPAMAIWNDSENRLNTVGRSLKKTLDELKVEFQDSEKRREQREKQDDEERIARGEPGLLKFRSLNYQYASKELWEEYVTRHIGNATDLLQRVAESINDRREAVFYYKEGSIAGGETAVKILTVTKKAGAFAASMLPIGRGLGLVKGALAAGGTSAAYNAGQGLAQQSGEMIFSDRTEFDFAQIGRDALKEGVGGFVGGLAGGALGKAFGNALRRRLARKLGKEFNEVMLGKVQDFIFVQWGPNVLTSPLTTSTRMVLERAMGERKTLSLEQIMDQIVSNLPEDALMGAAGAYVGGKVHPNPLHTSDGPAPDFGYTATAPQRNIYAGGQPSQAVPNRPGAEQAPAPVADVTPAPVAEVPPVPSGTPRPVEAPPLPHATETPVAETPRPLAETPQPVANQAPPTQAPAPVPQPSPVARQTGGRRQRGGRANEATTRRIRSVNEAPTRDMRAVGEPTDANLSVGDRRTTTRAVREDAQPTNRTEPSYAELAVGDRRTVTRAVDEGTQRQRSVDEPDATRGPVQPGVRDLPPGSVHRDLTYIEAYRSYNASVRQNPRFEAGIWRNKLTGEYVVVEGQREYVDPAQLFSNPEFQTSKGQPIDPASWHMVEHFHPGWGDRRQFYNRFPSAEDFRVILESQLARGTSEPVRSQIRAKDPVSGRDVITEYGYDPSNTAEPFYIRFKDQAGNTVERRFADEIPWNPNSGYRKFLDAQAAAEPAMNYAPDPQMIPGDERATGVWRVVEPPVVDTSVATPPRRSTLPMNVDTTQRTPVSRVTPPGPGDATQRGAAVPPRTAGPGELTQRMPVQGPDGATQRMTQQGPVDSNPIAPDMPAPGVGAGRGLPRGPVEIVPVESTSDARILMREWPADRPMRLLANGEAKAAWNRDYGQPGDPPPAWMDPAAGLVVDTDRVPRPSSNETYHVPAEDPYVMFNVPSPQEALSIYRQNEAANAINPANTARSFLLDHSTFMHMFERGRGYSPEAPAAFVDQNGRLYVDISRVDVTSAGQGPGGAGAPSGRNSGGGTQAMDAQHPFGGPPPMPGGAMRATQEMSPQTPVGEAPALPQNARRTADDEVTIIDDEASDTTLMTPQGRAVDAGIAGQPRSRDDKKTAPMGKVDPAAIAQRRIQGAEYISQNDVRFFHATNRAIVRLNEKIRSQGIPWSSDGGALWITTDSGSAFFGSNQVSPARTRQIYDRYGVPWDAEAARLANEPVYFEVDLTRLPSARDAGDIVADFADGGNGRSGVTTDYTIKDLTGSPFEAMREISGSRGGGAPPPARQPDRQGPASVPGDEGRASTLPQEASPPRPVDESLVAPSVSSRNGPPPGGGGPPPGGGGPPQGPGRPYESMGPDINPYSPMMPVQRIDDPVQAAQTYHRFLNMPERNRGRVRAMETAQFQDEWQRSPGFDRAPDRPAPVAWIDTHGNLIVDFDRANLDTGTGQAGPGRPAEDISYPEPEARSYPRDTYGVYQEGVPRGVSREIHNLGEAQQLWTDQVMAHRHVRFVKYEQVELVDLWQHGYGGQGDRPPLAWLDGQGFLVVDTNRVPIPEAVIEHDRRTGPL